MINIRQAVPNDSKEYLSFLNKLDSETSFMLYEPGEIKATDEDMKRRIEESIKGSFLIFAENNDKIIGFLSANRGHVNRIKHSAYIVIGILEDFRGKGLGKRLFEELESWAINNKIIRLELVVMVNNEKAIRLYKKMGFKIEGTKEKACIVNGEFVDEYYMGKVYHRFHRLQM